MKSTQNDRRRTIAALRSAIPYLRLFQGKTFVIKVGGVLLDEAPLNELLAQIGVLHQLGIRVVLVHGGGAQATEVASRLGAESRFVAGRRVTDQGMREALVMALNGSLQSDIVAASRRHGLSAVGVAGIDGHLIRARRRAPQRLDDDEVVDYGYVGDVEKVDPGILEELLTGGRLPVVSPVSADDAGEILNVNADVAAARIASALGAEKLIVATSVPGILQDADDPASLISFTDLAGLRRLRAEGVLVGGMLPKTDAMTTALEGGVHRVHVVSGLAPDALLVEVFTNEGSGTLVVREMGDLAPAESQPELAQDAEAGA